MSVKGHAVRDDGNPVVILIDAVYHASLQVGILKAQHRGNKIPYIAPM